MAKNQGLGILVFCTILCCTVFGSTTKHVIVLVMDGARYTETFGDSTHANIPNISFLSKQGTLFTNFRTAKNGIVATTETCPGHARITTGTIQNIPNNGTVFPHKPSFFQQCIKQNKATKDLCWIISSKDKLAILANSSAPDWTNKYTPSFDAGVNGNGTGGYREDSLTQKIVLQKLKSTKPTLLLVNYKGPDAMGHANNWPGYIAAIKEVDNYVNEVWNAVQSDPAMKNSTTLFVVNDHGRHTSDFTSHGDTCEGCRHIMCLAVGNKINVNSIDTTTREQIDIAPTIASLIGFSLTQSKGLVMKEIIIADVKTHVSNYK